MAHFHRPPCWPLATAEIIMVDNYVMVYKYLGDLTFYVTGSQEENELILYSVLQAFYESVSLLLRCVKHHAYHWLPWTHLKAEPHCQTHLHVPCMIVEP